MLTNTDLHRTFNNERFDHGGRFYGGWWQGLPKADRARILIDGETTVELDYMAFQPRLCFDLEGHPLPPEVDPYALPGLDMETYREAVKKTVAQLVYAMPGVPLGRAGASKELFPDAQTYANFAGQVEAALGGMAGWLRTGRGMALQFVDSEIADGVIHRLTAQDMPCLPIHDSFIVPASAEVRLGAAMIAAYREQVKRRAARTADPVIRGWTASEQERGAWEEVGPLPSRVIQGGT
ncbi:hypothetical protein [Croceibacterium ferulae]|uniref:hypothetical protein n=1 Tax=Croceibacterium ferulae TaxID=1854641 RepID=UPI000F865BE7|nr:hypothetical protein [Croceibacterium ferulae]